MRSRHRFIDTITVGVGIAAAGLLVLAVPAVSGCDHRDASATSGASAAPGVQGAAVSPSDSTLRDDLRAARSVRMYFDHHSVGANLIEGLKALDAEYKDGSFRILPFDEALKVDGPVLAHTSSGENFHPKDKVDGFATNVRGHVAELHPDIAMLKFCFVDFDPSSNVDDLFSHYEKTIRSLQREFPQVAFVHVTMPLKVQAASLKDRMNAMLGRLVWDNAIGVLHERYNRRLQQVFASDPIFDLARVESTGPGGRVNEFSYQGETVHALDPDYTTDGGHLNAAGQRAVATEFVHVVARTIKNKRVTSAEMH